MHTATFVFSKGFIKFRLYKVTIFIALLLNSNNLLLYVRGRVIKSFWSPEDEIHFKLHKAQEKCIAFITYFYLPF